MNRRTSASPRRSSAGQTLPKPRRSPIAPSGSSGSSFRRRKSSTSSGKSTTSPFTAARKKSTFAAGRGKKKSLALSPTSPMVPTPADGSDEEPTDEFIQHTMARSRSKSLAFALADPEVRESQQRVFVEGEEIQDRTSLMAGLMRKMGSVPAPPSPPKVNYEAKTDALFETEVEVRNTLRKEEADQRRVVYTNEIGLGKQARQRALFDQYVTLLPSMEILASDEALQRTKEEEGEHAIWVELVAYERDCRFELKRQLQHGKMKRVVLYDGCPFVHSNQCPLHKYSWIDGNSLRDQHFLRKYPKLKVHKDDNVVYERIHEWKWNRIRNANFRLFSARRERGLQDLS